MEGCFRLSEGSSIDKRYESREMLITVYLPALVSPSFPVPLLINYIKLCTASSTLGTLTVKPLLLSGNPPKKVNRVEIIRYKGVPLYTQILIVQQNGPTSTYNYALETSYFII